MNVVVQFHERVEEELEHWLAGHEEDDAERRALVRHYVDELVRRLGENEGVPPEAVRLGTSEPPSYRWRYTGEVFIEFQVRQESGGFFRSKRVRVIVTRIRLVPSE
jgi:hypothetical protein